MKLTDAQALIQAIITMRENADDKIASMSVALYPKIKNNNSLITAGTRINYNGKLLRAAVDLWDTEENNPNNAPSLWEEINYKDGYRIIPSTITVGTSFAKDEIGWWNNIKYQSLMDANVWTPDEYPAAWQKIEI